MNPQNRRRTVSVTLFAATLATLATLAGTASSAWAQTAAPAVPAGPMVMIAQFAPFLLVFAIMYFLMIRPQQQRQAELTRLQSSLAKGDRVLTQAGIYGTVVGVEIGRAHV